MYELEIILSHKRFIEDSKDLYMLIEHRVVFLYAVSIVASSRLHFIQLGFQLLRQTFH